MSYRPVADRNNFHPIARKRRISLGTTFAATFVGVWFTAAIIWPALKIPAFIILVVNIGQMIDSHNMYGSLDHFDPFWLILSAIALIAI